MDTRFADRELAAWERLQRLAGERGIELPPELAVECGEDSLSWSEAKCIAYLESEVARRLAGLARVTTPRTELPMPSRPLPERTERDYLTARAFAAAARAEHVVQVQGSPDSWQAHKAIAAHNHGRAVEARREAKRAAQARRGKTR